VELYFLRHGQAGQRSAWVGDDALRPLTEAGRERMVQEATTMRKLGVAPEVIVTSPLARSRQTAEVVAEILGLGTLVVEDDRLASGFSLDELGGVLASHLKEGSSGASVMLVGHEPDFSEIVGRLVGGADVLLKKGGLARVDLPARASFSGGSSRGLEGRGQLVWLLQPSVLAS
jgi:phosphohistidine phosphatase